MQSSSCYPQLQNPDLPESEKGVRVWGIEFLEAWGLGFRGLEFTGLGFKVESVQRKPSFQPVKNLRPYLLSLQSATLMCSCACPNRDDFDATEADMFLFLPKPG